MKIIPVILSGGSGTRLWPLSRKQYPKQFLKLASENTMIQETILRLSDLKCEPPIIVCNEQHRFLVAEQMVQIGIKAPAIILEPVAKNTAPAIAAACFKAAEADKDAVVIVLPSDHVIKDTEAFTEAAAQACKEAESGSLVTFGIKPVKPETGYGYIMADAGAADGKKALKLQQFVEKPSLEVAKQYLEAGNYYWNSGMFVFKAKEFLAELKSFEPEMYEATKLSYEKAVCDIDFIRLDKENFEKNPSNSIDYAVMEHTKKGKVIPLDCGWSDVGSWSALWDINDKDKAKNVITGDVYSDGCKNSYLYSESRTVAAIGLKDTVVIETKDAVLVADKDSVQKVKDIVDKLKAENKTIATEHRVGYRPWGFYDSIEKGSRYKVKHITVKPGAKLSVQMHYHRAEHWIVVSGTAKVRIGNEEKILAENESTFIPIGVIHALENPGKIPLELIEVQSGDYLEEDDIIRFEDKYGRV